MEKYRYRLACLLRHAAVYNDTQSGQNISLQDAVPWSQKPKKGEKEKNDILQR